MSSSSPRRNGANDPTAASGARLGAEPPAPPNVYVYQPQAADAPAYEEYADPAAAHGWTDAYDETRELPTVVDGAVPGVPGGPGGPGGPRESGEPGTASVPGR